MSTYINELTEATTTINKSDFNEVLAKIKYAASADKWTQYGWRNDVLQAKTLIDVMNIFNIELSGDENGNYRPIINNVYLSSFFDDLVHIIAPYMTDGKIIVDDGYFTTIVTFNNHDVQIDKT